MFTTDVQTPLTAIEADLWMSVPPISATTPSEETEASILTHREQEVLELLARGTRNRDVASQLFISEDTVKSHVRRILRKLNATNRAEAVSRYAQLRATPLPAGPRPVDAWVDSGDRRI